MLSAEFVKGFNKYNPETAVFTILDVREPAEIKQCDLPSTNEVGMFYIQKTIVYHGYFILK